MPYVIYTDLSSRFLDPKLVDLGLALIHVGAYGTMSSTTKIIIFNSTVKLETVGTGVTRGLSYGGKLG